MVSRHPATTVHVIVTNQLDIPMDIIAARTLTGPAQRRTGIIGGALGDRGAGARFTGFAPCGGSLTETMMAIRLRCDRR